MEVLVKITEKNGKSVVRARDLHQFLESKQEFANWIKNRISRYGLVENEDYVVFDNLIKNPPRWSSPDRIRPDYRCC